MPKGKKHTPEQIIAILRRIDQGETADAVCRSTNISAATLYRWKLQYGALELDELKPRRPPSPPRPQTSTPTPFFDSLAGKKSTMPPKFEAVFSELRAILTRHVGSLSVAEDSPGRYCLEGGRHPKHQTPIPIAWVQVSKAYVSFHHMGVCARPDLLKGVSNTLRARMQGKSCFNFKSVDKILFAELEDLAVRSFDALRNAPFMK